MKLTPIGVDLAKSVFQVHEVDEQTGEEINKRLKRSVFLTYFAGRSPCLIGLEACGASHDWARELMALGHEVKVLQGRYVKAFNVGNKTDAADEGE